MKRLHLMLHLAVWVGLCATGNASADVVTDWNSVTLDAIRATRTNPPHATRALAMVHAAIFDAVNGIEHLYAIRLNHPGSARVSGLPSRHPLAV